jgi:hypothetical protein
MFFVIWNSEDRTPTSCLAGWASNCFALVGCASRSCRFYSPRLQTPVIEVTRQFFQPPCLDVVARLKGFWLHKAVQGCASRLGCMMSPEHGHEFTHFQDQRSNPAIPLAACRPITQERPHPAYELSLVYLLPRAYLNDSRPPTL